MSYRPFSVIIQQSVVASAAATSGIKFEIYNDSGVAITELQPVTSDGNGRAKAIDVSVESDALKIIGLAGQAIADSDYGYVYSHGKFENITTSYNFGDYVYVSKTGNLTNIAPSEGVDGFVAGDFIIRVGVIVRNRATPSQKDLLINIGIIGQV